MLPEYMPRKIRELVADLERAGWLLTPGGKGSHRKFAHLRSTRKIILSGAAGSDAHPYQEKLVRSAVREARK
jgi:predicted RNA binding protein YcfA (HicA-like mRNA interferase family)